MVTIPLILYIMLVGAHCGALYASYLAHMWVSERVCRRVGQGWDADCKTRMERAFWLGDYLPFKRIYWFSVYFFLILGPPAYYGTGLGLIIIATISLFLWLDLRSIAWGIIDVIHRQNEIAPDFPPEQKPEVE